MFFGVIPKRLFKWSAIPRFFPSETHQCLMGADCFGSIAITLRVKLRISSVCIERPRLPPVTQADVENLPEPLFGCRRLHRSYHLNAFREVPEHPVRGADKEVSLAWIGVSIGEMEDAGVFQKSADNRSHTNVVRPSGTPGRRQQKPRMIRSIGTPASDASHNA